MRSGAAAPRLPRLVGERANDAEDPRRNTAMQRAWMYAEDPALTFVLREQENARTSASLSLIGGVDGFDETSDREDGGGLRLNATI